MTGWLDRRAHRWFPVYLVLCLWLTCAALLPVLTNPFAFAVNYATPVRLSVAKGSSSTTAANWGATSGATTTTAGSFLWLSVACQNNSSATNSCSTPTGWTAGPTKVVSNSTARAFVAVFTKVAAGSDAVPTFTITGTNTCVTILEELSGLNALDITFTGGTLVGSGTVHAGANSTTFAADYVLASIAGRAVTFTSWGGGQTADDTTTASSAQLWTSTQSLSATGSIDPQATISAGIVACVAIAVKRSVV